MYLLWQVNKLNWTKTLSYASQRCTSWRALQLPTRFKRYISWTKITQHFQESKMKVTQRSEGERLISYTKTSRKEKRKRVGLVGGGCWIQRDIPGTDQYPWSDCGLAGKEESEKATAEEMRKRPTEKLSETKRRNNGRWRKLWWFNTQKSKALKEKLLNKLKRSSRSKESLNYLWRNCINNSNSKECCFSQNSTSSSNKKEWTWLC